MRRLGRRRQGEDDTEGGDTEHGEGRGALPPSATCYKVHHQQKPPPPRTPNTRFYFHGTILHTVWSIAVSEQFMEADYWSSIGIYKVERLQGSDESLRTNVYKRAMYRRAEIPDDVVKGMSIAELAVQQNLSKDTAYVSVSSGQCIFLESLFPRIQMRGRRRRFSGDLGFWIRQRR